jgi:hypothetical protein
MRARLEISDNLQTSIIVLEMLRIKLNECQIEGLSVVADLMDGSFVFTAHHADIADPRSVLCELNDVGSIEISFGTETGFKNWILHDFATVYEVELFDAIEFTRVPPENPLDVHVVHLDGGHFDTAVSFIYSWLTAVC